MTPFYFYNLHIYLRKYFLFVSEFNLVWTRDLTNLLLVCTLCWYLLNSICLSYQLLDTSCNHENKHKIPWFISFFDFLSAEFGIISPAQPSYHYIINLSLPTKLNNLVFFILIFPAQCKYSQSSNPFDFIQQFYADPLCRFLHYIRSFCQKNCLSAGIFFCVNHIRDKRIKRTQKLFEDSPHNEKRRI